MKARALLPLVLLVACRKAEPEVRPDDKKSEPARVQCTIPQDEIVTGTITIPPRCDLAITKVLRVPPGATIEIGAGAKLTFTKGAGLVVSGGLLRARGTEKEPIVFTSGTPTRAPGDWNGILFAQRSSVPTPDAAVIPAGESLLEHVVVEYAGAGPVNPKTIAKADQAAGISVMTVVDKVALAHVRLRHNAGAGLHVQEATSIAKLEALTIDVGNTIGVSVPFELFPLLGKDPDASVRLFGNIAKSMVLPKHAKPYVFAGHIKVGAVGTPVTFEIAKGNVLQFELMSELVVIGSTKAVATLVARDVTFTALTPKQEWGGLAFAGESGAVLENVIFEYAGAVFSGNGVVRLPTDETRMHVTGSTFRNNSLAAFEANKDCKAWDAPTFKNVSVGKPLCALSPFASMFGSLSGSSFGSSFGAGGLGSIGAYDPKKDPWGSDSAGLGGLSGLGNVGGGKGGYDPPKPTAKVVESSITASGALPVDVVRKAVRDRTGSLRSCVQGASSGGTLTVSFTIDAKGSVSGSKVTGGTLTDASTRSCVTGTFDGASFPAADPPGTTSVTATHDYQP